MSAFFDSTTVVSVIEEAEQGHNFDTGETLVEYV